MVYTPLATGATVGAILIGAYLYFEVGAFAAPQVPRSLFDERKLGWSLIAGLGVGSPLSVLLLLLFNSYAGGFLVSVIFEVALLVGFTELAQWLLLRSVYFGSDRSGPFYVMGMRSGIAGILVLAAVTRYFGGPSLDVLGVAWVLVQGVAILAVEVACGLLALPAPEGSRRIGGGPLSGGLVGAFGFFLIGSGLLFGPEFGIAAAALAAGGSVFVYRRTRVLLRRVKPPALPSDADPGSGTDAGSGFGRTDR